MSFHDVVLFRPRVRPFVGFANYVNALADPVFWESLLTSVIWVVAAVGLQFLLGLAAALLLNRRFAWRGVARALIIVPWALPSVIIGLIWTWMLDFNLGLVNEIGLRLHLLAHPVPWLSQPGTALAAVILAVVWQGFPFFAVTLLAGLQAIPARTLRSGVAGRRGRRAEIPQRDTARPRRRDDDGAAAAHDLGRQLARPDPGHDRRRSRHGHANAAAACLPHRVVRRQLRPGLGARGHPDADIAWRGRGLSSCEAAPHEARSSSGCCWAPSCLWRRS